MTAAVKTPFALDENDRRVEDTDIHKAVREIVANALIHADYHGRRGIVIERRFEEILISNPGAMRIAKSVAVDGGTSDPRNAGIFNIFALIDVGERSGMGLNNLYSIWEREGFARPIVTEEFDPDRTIIKFSTARIGEVTGSRSSQNRLRSDPSVTQGLPKSDLSVTQGLPKSDPTSMQDMPSSVKRVLAALCDDPDLTLRGLSSKLDLSKTTVTKAVGTLISTNRIRRVGPRFGGHWEIVSAC